MVKRQANPKTTIIPPKTRLPKREAIQNLITEFRGFVDLLYEVNEQLLALTNPSSDYFERRKAHREIELNCNPELTERRSKCVEAITDLYEALDFREIQRYRKSIEGIRHYVESRYNEIHSDFHLGEKQFWPNYLFPLRADQISEWRSSCVLGAKWLESWLESLTDGPQRAEDGSASEEEAEIGPEKETEKPKEVKPGKERIQWNDETQRVTVRNTDGTRTLFDDKIKDKMAYYLFTEYAAEPGTQIGDLHIMRRLNNNPKLGLTKAQRLKDRKQIGRIKKRLPLPLAEWLGVGKGGKEHCLTLPD